MKFQVEDRGSCIYVEVKEGRLDVLSTSKMKEELISVIQNQGNKNILLNINSCSFCDASGLSAIQAVHCMCEKAAGMLIVTGIQANIEKMIKICKLDSVWNIAKDTDEAEKILTQI